MIFLERFYVQALKVTLKKKADPQLSGNILECKTTAMVCYDKGHG